VGVFTAGDFAATVLLPNAPAPKFGRGEALGRLGVVVKGFLGVDAICDLVGVAIEKLLLVGVSVGVIDRDVERVSQC